MELLICTNLPFNFVENKKFQKWASKNVPKFTIKSATTFSRNKLSLLYNKVNNAVDSKLEADLPEYKRVAFTTNMWTSRNNDSYISTTLHYIDKDFNLKNLVVGCAPFKGSYTCAVISKELDKIIEEIPGLLPDTTRFAVYDSEANIKVAMAKSPQIFIWVRY